MLINDTVLTREHITQDSQEKELLLNQKLFDSKRIVGFSFPIDTFMLKIPLPLPKKPFRNFNLGKIFGSLRRKDLYEDR